MFIFFLFTNFVNEFKENQFFYKFQEVNEKRNLNRN